MSQLVCDSAVLNTHTNLYVSVVDIIITCTAMKTTPYITDYLNIYPLNDRVRVAQKRCPRSPFSLYLNPIVHFKTIRIRMARFIDKWMKTKTTTYISFTQAEQKVMQILRSYLYDIRIPIPSGANLN